MLIPVFIRRVYSFYHEGFSRMTVGKTLWMIILIKLFIMFAILKVFFFPNFLNAHFITDKNKADHVREELINRHK
jgi:Domain of unknown function (DUF4492)